jgi:hypothetical protein
VFRVYCGEIGKELKSNQWLEIFLSKRYITSKFMTMSRLFLNCLSSFRLYQINLFGCATIALDLLWLATKLDHVAFKNQAVLPMRGKRQHEVGEHRQTNRKVANIGQVPPVYTQCRCGPSTLRLLHCRRPFH